MSCQVDYWRRVFPQRKRYRDRCMSALRGRGKIRLQGKEMNKKNTSTQVAHAPKVVSYPSFSGRRQTKRNASPTFLLGFPTEVRWKEYVMPRLSTGCERMSSPRKSESLASARVSKLTATFLHFSVHNGSDLVDVHHDFLCW